MPVKQYKPELLAPAGDRDSLLSALAAGADAVYLGLDTLNARRNAQNFTEEGLGAACDMAHLAGKRIYLTANTLTLDAEMDAALDLVGRAWERGVDAAIVADLGLAAALRSGLPSLELHASTQMNVQNLDAIEFLGRRGFSRVTLARELSLEQIEALSKSDVELEVFAHGALCVCYSGQCLMSSLIGRRSANRGLCAQPCRLAYSLEDASGPLATSAGKHLLSPRDLSTIGLLPQLVDAGVASLKIEGRMKAPDYVANVVSAYRSALDRVFEEHDSYAPSADELSTLDESFSRGFTSAYLSGEWDESLMNHKRPNNRGVLVGRVASISNGLVTLALTKPLNEGDVLEFWTARGNHRMEVDAEAAEGSVELSLTLPVLHPVSPGDRLFRVRNAKMRETASSLIEGFHGPIVFLDFKVEARIGKPLTVTVSDARGVSASAQGDPVEPARTRAVSEGDIRAHVGRLGGTPYEVSHWEIALDEGAGMGFSALHALRREALEAYEARVLSPWRNRRGFESTQLPVVDPSSVPSSEKSGEEGTPPLSHLAFLASDVDKLERAHAAGVSRFYLSFDFFRSLRAFPPEGEYSIILPTTADDDELHAMLGLLPPGCDVVCDSLATLITAASAGHGVEAGVHLGLLNSRAAVQVIDAGASRIWASPELSIDQLESFSLPEGIGSTLTVVGHQELMVMRHCVFMAQGPCSRRCESCVRRHPGAFLKDEKGYGFPVSTDLSGRSHIYNGVCLDAISTTPDLLRAGIDRFVVDGTCMSSADIDLSLGRLKRALGGNEPEPRPDGTTTGHLFRGVL